VRTHQAPSVEAIDKNSGVTVTAMSEHDLICLRKYSHQQDEVFKIDL
jgi:hypothetical protein